MAASPIAVDGPSSPREKWQPADNKADVVKTNGGDAANGEPRPATEPAVQPVVIKTDPSRNGSAAPEPSSASVNQSDTGRGEKQIKVLVESHRVSDALRPLSLFVSWHAHGVLLPFCLVASLLGWLHSFDEGSNQTLHGEWPRRRRRASPQDNTRANLCSCAGWIALEILLSQTVAFFSSCLPYTLSSCRRHVLCSFCLYLFWCSFCFISSSPIRSTSAASPNILARKTWRVALAKLATSSISN